MENRGVRTDRGMAYAKIAAANQQLAQLVTERAHLEQDIEQAISTSDAPQQDRDALLSTWLAGVQGNEND